MRKVATLTLLLLLVVGAGWSAAWLYAAREAGRRTDAWIAAERAQGRIWSCPHRDTTGYPFALSITCLAPTYAGQAMGQTVEAVVARLKASVTLANPREIALALQGPFSFHSSDGGTAVTATWQNLVVSLGTLPDIRTVTLHAAAIDVSGTFGGAGQGASRAASLNARLSLESEPPDPTLAFAVTAGGAPIAALDDLLGGSMPADVEVDGRLDRANIGGAATPEEAMERWRQSGGHIDIERATVSRAGASAAATGALRLDDAHRVAGHLDAEFVGLEPILARYGISGNIAAVSSLIGSLFGGGGAPHKAPTVAGALDLPVSLRNGRLGIGPITTGVRFPPLY